jgi:hypothetical protein
MSEERTDRLIFIKAIGCYIDPRTIALVQATAYWKQDLRHKAVVIIETRAGGTYRIPWPDLKGAEKMRDTLAMIANRRGREVKKAPNGVDYKGQPMPGDVDYRAAAEALFSGH